MTAEGHLFFSIACAVFAKNAELTPVLAQGDWWHIVPSAVLTCLLPDIDHPKSFLGQRLSWISKPVARAFGHRGFTHSLLAVFGALTLFYLKVPDSWIVPADALQGLVLGYLSHILADMLTPAGVPLLWPCRWRFRLPILATKFHLLFHSKVASIRFLFFKTYFLYLFHVIFSTTVQDREFFPA
jgi:inner membrane protein